MDSRKRLERLTVAEEMCGLADKRRVGGSNPTSSLVHYCVLNNNEFLPMGLELSCMAAGTIGG